MVVQGLWALGSLSVRRLGESGPLMLKGPDVSPNAGIGIKTFDSSTLPSPKTDPAATPEGPRREEASHGPGGGYRSDHLHPFPPFVQESCDLRESKSESRARPNAGTPMRRLLLGSG